MTERIAAVLLAAAMFHLNIARADYACGSHAQSDDAREAAAAPHHSQAEHGHSPPAGTEQSDADCDTPVLPDCCQAMASCSVMFDANLRADGAGAAANHDEPSAVATRVPLSRLRSPEPPPPRV